MLTVLRFIPRIRIVFLAVALLALVSLAWAVVPRNLNFHGRLLDASGAPIVTATDVAFKIFNAETGGAELWTETQISIIPDPNGFINVVLGSVSPFPAALDFSQDYWLELVVAGAAISPRQRLTSSPYAFRAVAADTVINGAINTAKLANSAVTLAKLNTAEVDSRYVKVAGDTMTGTLILPANGLIVGTTQFVLANGRVGIGTAEPQSKLDVEGDISGGGMLIACASASAEGTLSASRNLYNYEIGVAIPLVIIPVYIPAGTTQLRGKISVKSNYTQNTMKVWFGIGSSQSNIFTVNTWDRYVLSDELNLTLASGQTDWQELIVYGGIDHWGTDPAKVFINSFAVYSMN